MMIAQFRYDVTSMLDDDLQDVLRTDALGHSERPTPSRTALTTGAAAVGDAHPQQIHDATPSGGGCPNIIQLPENAVHLWFCNDRKVNDPLLDSYYDLIDEGERERQRRFYFEHHRIQYLVTRAMVRCVLSLYVRSVSPRDWQFASNRHGKPWVSGPVERPVSFNLSHTPGMVVLAITKTDELGIDVERERGRDTPVEIADRFFAPAERQALRLLPERERHARFCQIWTLKEAYIKARGLGLSLPLDAFAFEFLSPNGVRISFTEAIQDDPQRWSFSLLRAGDRHTVALAVARGDVAGDLPIDIHEVVPQLQPSIAQWPVLRTTNGRNLEGTSGMVYP
jgi:4'-phosphopantetheinyl transferase